MKSVVVAVPVSTAVAELRLESGVNGGKFVVQDSIVMVKDFLLTIVLKVGSPAQVDYTAGPYSP